MKNMAKQMELFEPVERGFEEGGLMDEGGTVDPVSGNDVPPGSTQEEVRDDVPAQLSEGEFVFPADVVRYIGLEKLMRMRQEAKMGLAAMEAMGQMGNSEEAVMPDDLPFDMYDLDIEEEDEYNMASGGVVKMQQGGTTYTPPTIGGFTPPPPVTTGFSGPQPVQPFQSGQGKFQVAGAAEGAVTPKTSIQGVTPTFSDFVGMNVPGVDFKMVTFYDENGQAKVLKQFPDGSYEDPANPGVKVNPTDMGLTQEIKTEVTPTEQRVQTAQVRDTGGDRDDAEPSPGSTDARGIGYDASALTPDLREAISNYGAGLGTLKDAFNPQTYSAVAKGLGLIDDVPAKTSAITSSAFGGVLDSFSGLTSVTVDSLGRPSRNYAQSGLIDPRNPQAGTVIGTTSLDKLGTVKQNQIAKVARATINRMSGFFQDEEGKALGSNVTQDNLESALMDDFGLSKSDVNAIANRGGNYNKNDKLSRHLAGLIANEERTKETQQSMDDYAAITSGKTDVGKETRDAAAGVSSPEMSTSTGDDQGGSKAGEDAAAGGDGVSTQDDGNYDGGLGFGP